MNKYPPKIIDSAFRNAIKRGAIIRTKIKFGGISSPKFLITLNKDPSLNVIYVFVSTSQIDWYNKHPEAESNIIRIPPGEISCFYRETIINCRRERKLLKNELKKSFREGELELKGHLPNNYLIKLNKIIRNSRYISPQIKKIICT